MTGGESRSGVETGEEGEGLKRVGGGGGILKRREEKERGTGDREGRVEEEQKLGEGEEERRKWDMRERKEVR